MKGKLTDTNNTINKGGRAEKYWRHKSVKSKASSPVRNKDEIDLQKILQRYNLKGFEFGNWLNNDERYDRVLACEDSLAELAKIMGMLLLVLLSVHADPKVHWRTMNLIII